MIRFLSIALVVSLLGCGRGTDSNRINDGLVLVNSMPPWRDTQYNWDEAIKIVRKLQHLTESELLAVFKAWERQRKPLSVDGYEPDCKPYIAIILMFDVPEHAPSSQMLYFKGWDMRAETLDRDEKVQFSNKNSDGTVNLAWPICWNGGNPHMVASCRGSTGPEYSPTKHYLYFRDRFNLRDLK